MRIGLMGKIVAGNLCVRSFITLAGVTVLASAFADQPKVMVDFTQKVREIRPALHSAGWGPRSSVRFIQNDDAMVKAMNLTYARTHDWALVNSGQRVCDYQYIFPLFDKDAKDPSNYYFEPTDHLLELSRNLGLKLFYRLGTSIEHTDGMHFNAAVPKDFDKTAEIFAGIIRHYNRGWANGKQWNIGYWEIWNEPDGINNMWCLPESEGGKDCAIMRDKFVKFFVICLKRLKAEYPELKIGGPALCVPRVDYFKALLAGCKEAGVAPDFVSWHYYGSDPKRMSEQANVMRELCDSFGFTKTELVLNEWHYILTWDGIHGRNSTPAMVARALDGPTGHNRIDSACFTLATLVNIQSSKLDMANYYGCSHVGNWGYMDDHKMPNKNWHALKLFGEIVGGYRDICAAKVVGDNFAAMPVVSADGKKRALLLVDYRGIEQVLKVQVKGISAGALPSATLLDHTHDNFPVEISRRGDMLTLVKPDKNSAAFFIEFNEGE